MGLALSFRLSSDGCSIYHTQTRLTERQPSIGRTVDRRAVPCFDSRQRAAFRMTESSTITNTNAHEPERSQQPSKQHPELRDLVPFVAGGKLFGIFAEDADGTAECKPLASLPHAPATILGVVCVRGRALTVLDPVAICTTETEDWPKPLPYVVVLRGDEQLALAAEACRDMITIAAADISTDLNRAEARPAVLGVVRHAGEEITILDI